MPNQLTQFIDATIGGAFRQCVVLINDFRRFRGQPTINIATANDLKFQPGFIKFSGHNFPHPGDILLFKPGGPDKIGAAGHVGLFIQGLGNGLLKIFNSNDPEWTGPNYATVHWSSLAGWIPEHLKGQPKHGPLYGDVMHSGIGSHWEIFKEAAKKYHVPVWLLAAISWNESHGGETSRQYLGDTGAINTWKAQVFGGAETLRHWLNVNHGDYRKALGMYGPAGSSHDTSYAQRIQTILVNILTPGAASGGSGGANFPWDHLGGWIQHHFPGDIPGNVATAAGNAAGGIAGDLAPIGSAFGRVGNAIDYVWAHPLVAIGGLIGVVLVIHSAKGLTSG